MIEESYPALFIGGEWVKSNSGRMITSIDPSTEEPWAEVPEASESDVDRAVSAARAAMRGPWSKKITASQRGGLLLKLADLIRKNAERLARLETRDNGKLYKETLVEVQRSADYYTFFAGAADKIYGEQIPYRPDALAYTRREPVGVVAALMPWNAPFQLMSWKLGPALAAGNAVVVKPSEFTSVTAFELAKLFKEAGFPDGVLNIVPGYGKEVGAALVRHPHVNKVTMTGEHRTAQAIMKLAAEHLKRCSFECGGKAPHILFSDADLDKALIVATQSAFRSTGQSCSLGSRLFVQRPIYRNVVDRMTERAGKIRVGMPMDARTHIGPHTTAQQLEKTRQYIELGLESGARLMAGGKRPPDLNRGYFIEPTVFADVDNQSRLAQEEVFGPVLSIIPFDTEEEVIEMANNVQYGLNSGLWTSDIGRAHRIANQLEAGLVSINTFRPIHWMLPYGGYKVSGLGRENGLEAIHDYTEVKTVVVELSEAMPVDPFAN